VTRLYVPATVRELARLEAHGSIGVGDDAVLAPDDSEESEYDALMTAAETSGVLATELDVGERRRVVVVAEVDTVPPTLDLADVVAVHADAEDLSLGSDPQDLGDLGWYATQEIPRLLEG
jgi:hypothetical protein